MIVMENERAMKDEIIAAMDVRFGSFRTEMITQFAAVMDGRLGSFRTEITGAMDGLRNEFTSFRNEVNRRFDNVDKDLGRLEVKVDGIDDKFSLITEGQAMVLEVLETRVAHIENILNVRSAV